MLSRTGKTSNSRFKKTFFTTILENYCNKIHFFFLSFAFKLSTYFSIAGAGGLSANGNMFGNFARWNEPSREGSLSKKVDYKVVNASPVESPSSHNTRVRLNHISFQGPL